MSEIVNALRSKRVLVMDGAMGSELQKLGLRMGECGEEWNLTQPEKVSAVHRAYVEAGADLLTTNTFQVIPDQLRKRHCRFSSVEVVHAAVHLASQHRKWVVGALGPFDDTFRFDEHRQRCIWPCVDVVAAMSRCDAILVETISDIRPLVMAVEMKPNAHDQAFLASATYLCDGRGIRTFNGITPEAFAQQAGPRVAAVGMNCGRDIGQKECLEIVRRYRDATSLPIFVKPNAGTPQRIDGRWVYPHSVDEMAGWVPELLKAGATMIGGCCGTTPEHIAAIRKVIDEWNLAVR